MGRLVFNAHAVVSVFLGIVIALYFVVMIFEKVSQIVDDKRYRGRLEEYFNLVTDAVKVSVRVEDVDKRMRQFETDFKTYDENLEFRLGEIEERLFADCACSEKKKKPDKKSGGMKRFSDIVKEEQATQKGSKS